MHKGESKAVVFLVSLAQSVPEAHVFIGSLSRGGLLNGILCFLFLVRPLACSWGVRGRRFRQFPVDFGGSGGPGQKQNKLFSKGRHGVSIAQLILLGF